MNQVQQGFTTPQPIANAEKVQQQYQQPVQQQAPVYSNEQQMPAQQQVPVMPQTQQVPSNVEGIQKVEVLLDKESLRLLNEAHGQFGESIVNLGIKMFAETDVYKNYMKREEFKTVEEVKEQEANGNSTMSLTPNVSNGSTTNKTKQGNDAPKPGSSFQAW